MSLLGIVMRSLRQHFLSTCITSCSIALAGGLILSVWTIKDQANDAFVGVHAGFDAVSGHVLPSCNWFSTPFFMSRPHQAMSPGKIISTSESIPGSATPCRLRWAIISEATAW